MYRSVRGWGICEEHLRKSLGRLARGQVGENDSVPSFPTPLSLRGADGKPVYTERLPDLTTSWASPVADASGRLYFASAGKSYVLQAGAEFRVLAVNDLDDPTHASPAIAGGRLYFVGGRMLHCVGNK